MGKNISPAELEQNSPEQKQIAEHQEQAGPTKEEILEEINKQAKEAGLSPAIVAIIANCESTLNPEAKNPRSTAKGLFQFTDPTWEWIQADGHQFDWRENLKQFIKWYPKYPHWWEECLPKL